MECLRFFVLAFYNTTAFIGQSELSEMCCDIDDDRQKHKKNIVFAFYYIFLFHVFYEIPTFLFTTQWYLIKLVTYNSLPNV